MPEEIYPGAEWNPGVAAGFSKGRTNVNAVICHYTVGRNSTNIGLDGYFNFLVSRDGHIQQFAECSALTWHAGDANIVGPGIEIEFLDEVEGIFTDAARDATSGLIHWINREFGVPLTYYDGPRISPASMREFVAHGSVQQSQAHTDYWPRPDWDRMVAGTQPAPPTPLPQPVFVHARRDLMSFITFRTGDHWDTFRVNDDGQVVHSYYPWERGPGDLTVGHYVVGDGNKSEGKIDGVVETHPGGLLIKRTDLYVERDDGTLTHYFQSSDDWKWNEDGERW